MLRSRHCWIWGLLPYFPLLGKVEKVFICWRASVSSKRLFFCWIVPFLIPLFAYGQGGDRIDLKAEGIISLDKVHPGDRFQVAVIADIPDGWHINAHVPSSDYLIPTELRFEEESGLSFDEVIYPPRVEKTFSFSDRKLAVYGGKITIGGTVAISKDFPIGKRILRGRLSYQACSDQVCLFPAEVDVNIPIEVVGPEQPVHRINREVFSLLEVRRAEVHHKLGKRYQGEGLLDKAIEECREAIKLKPDNPHYFSTLAELYYKNGDYDKAIAAIKKAIALNPEDDALQGQLKKFEKAKDAGQ